MSGATRQSQKKELLKYLLLQVKQKELDADRAKEFIRAIGGAEEAADDPIAVVGIACRLPGAPDKETFWSNLVEGRESIGDYPEPRVEDLQRIDGGGAYVKRGGYLDRIDLFDPQYFGIPPKSAEQLDPYHRNMMEVLVETMEDAGYSRSDFQGTNTGIFVGNDHTHRMMKSYLPFLPAMDFAAVSGSWSGILASRLSYHLNFRGPAAVLDTGCSSGLIALDAAAKAVRQGDCDTAFVGAINLLLQPLGLGNETESDAARVRAFDASANGTVWSEGVAGLLIKPLSRALADRDHVYGVVLGNAINGDGRSNGITAPNARSQQELLVSAWKRAGISPESLSYIEAHGTGTTLGDPIEIKGLKGAFGAYTKRKQFCAMGSVKTNVGHTVGAAGLVSLIKTLLSLEHGVIPPSLHFDVPNPYGDLADSPVYVNDRLSVWEEGETPRRAGVSSFSLTGTNSHVVLEEAPAAARRSGRGHGPNLYPISARSEELLLRTAASQLSSLENHPEYRLDDVCFTMQVGREHQPVRAVVMCEDRAGLLAGLRQLLAPRDEQAPPGDDVVVWRADLDPPEADSVPRDTGATAPDTAGTGRRNDLPARFRHLAEAAQRFLQGRGSPFAALERDADVRRVPLPPQLFDHARYWDESVRAVPATAAEAEPEPESEDWVHELLQQPSPLEGEPNPAPHRFLIAWVWSEVLGYPTIRGSDDFLAMGGDSVSSIKITNILNAQLDLDIPIGVLLAERYFDDFAHVLNESYGLTDEYLLQRSAGAARDAAPEEAAAETYELPLTASQRGIFWSSRLDETSVAYNETALMLRRGTLDVARLEQSIRALARRHDSLRSTFHLVDGEPVQVVHADVPVTIDHRRLARPVEGETHEDSAREQMREFVRPFTLHEGPLFRVGYFEFDDGMSCVAVDFHHTVIDGMSMGILLRDLGMIAEDAELPPLGRSYRSAVLELRERQTGAEVAAHRDYWVDRFADGVPTLRLTTDRQRGEVVTTAGATHFVELDARTLELAKQYAGTRNLTLYTMLLGVFQQLLSRMSGQHDVVIGAPVMGRPDLSYQDLVGMFVNTLPLRITAAPESTVDSFLTGLRATVLGGFEHQIYPLESMIEEIGPPREPGRRPLFDVCFVHQNVDMGLDREDSRVVLFDDGSTKYDITLSTRVVGDRLLLKWEYATALFDEETIALYAERYLTLLRSFLSAEDDAPLGTLGLMPPREVERIRRLATTSTEPRETVGVVGLFELQVAADPDRTALIKGEERLTYGELNQRANRIAHGLARQEATSRGPVALLMDRSFDMVAAILGVLKAGGHYLPLSTDFPTGRLQVMLDDSGAGLLLASPGRMEQAAELASDRLRVTGLDTCAAANEADNPGLPSNSDDPIYIMYTSGTTGVPKGSVVRQRGALRVARPSTFYRPDSSDVFCLLSDYSFDGSVYDMFGALTNGASLVIMDKADVLDLDRLGAAIERHRITSFFITASMFNALVDHAPERLGSIRMMIFGGEMASPTHVRRAFEMLGPGRIANGYGPTESTVFAAVHRFDSFEVRDAVPIGRPVGDTSLWVLDDQQRLQPIGAPGELYIGGAGLADGYLNQPELTEQRFVTSPEVPGERLYRTGDLVTLKNNGLLYYTGRIDEQVKLRGYRIELAEILHVALEQPDVRLAHAGVHESGEGRSLCLWVRYADGREPDEQRLRAALSQRLPHYMVPAFIVAVDEIPWTRNGKVDVAALPRPKTAPAAEASAPATELQRRIAAAWSRVLGGAVEDIDANFFALGGDSIKAIQIVSVLKQDDVPLQVADLLEHQTVRTLAETVEGGPGGRRAVRVYDQSPVTGPVVPNPIQRRFLSDPDNHGRVYTQSMLVTFGAQVPEDRLAHAVSRLAQYHDLLRVRIADDGGLLVREPDAEGLVHVETAPRGLAGEELSDYLRALQARVDVRGGAAVAAAAGLGRHGEQCALAIHHLAVDVVSWGILLEDLAACLADPDVAFAPKSVPFRDWAAELERYTRDGGFSSQLPYWTDLARAASEDTDLFTEREVVRKETVAEVVRFGRDDAGALLERAREADGLDAAQVLLAVLARALGSWKGRNHILLTLEGHGREPFAGGHDLGRTVGWFTSAFPHRLTVGDGVEGTLEAVRRSFEELPDKGFGFGALRWLDSGSGEEHALLAGVRPQISFNYLGDQGGQPGDIEVVHLPAEVTVGEDHRSPFVLDVNAYRNDGDLLVEFRYPAAWRDRGEDRALLTAVRGAFHEIRDTVTAADRSALRTSTSVDQDVLDSVLFDVLGED